MIIKSLPSPITDTTLINRALISQVVAGSRLSPRKRMLLPLHKSLNSPLHRMINAIQPHSYIQPHRHLHPPKAESVIVLQGALFCFLFSETGQVEEIYTLRAGSLDFGIDCEPGVFHTFMAIDKDTVLFEVKPGPYEQNLDKDFAPWAPVEGTKEAKDYMEQLYCLAKGFPAA